MPASPAIVWFREGPSPRRPSCTRRRRGVGSPIAVRLHPRRGIAGLTRPGRRVALVAASCAGGAGRGAGETRRAARPVRRGAGAVLERLARDSGAGALYWNRRYDAAGVAVDRAIKGDAQQSRSRASTASCWPSPGPSGRRRAAHSASIRHSGGILQASGEPPPPLPSPSRIKAGARAGRNAGARDAAPAADEARLGRRFSRDVEAGRGQRSQASRGISSTKSFPAMPTAATAPTSPSSRLSPHLAFGEISPRQIWAATRHAEAPNPKLARRGEIPVGTRVARIFLSPAVPQSRSGDENFDARFDAFEWPRRDDKRSQRGRAA